MMSSSMLLFWKRLDPVQPAVILLLSAVLLAALLLGVGEFRPTEPRNGAARDAARRLEDAAQAALARLAEQEVWQVRGMAEQPESLHRLVLDDTVSLVVLSRDGQRVFPPEEPGQALMEEQQRLTTTAGALAEARAEMRDAPSAWIWLGGAAGSSLLHCRREARDDVAKEELCLVLAAAPVRRLLAEAMESASAGLPPMGLSLIDPSGQTSWSRGTLRPAFSAPLIHPLAGALHGWQIATAAYETPRGDPTVPGLAAPTLLLFAGWLPLLWLAQRSWRARLSDNRRDKIARIRAIGRRAGLRDAAAMPLAHPPRQEGEAPRPEVKTPRPARAEADRERWFVMGDLHIDREALRAFRGQQVINLTSREITLLSVLHARAGVAVRRDDLFDLCWGRDYMPNSRALDQYVSALRRKIERDAFTPALIRTVHGVGYRYDADPG